MIVGGRRRVEELPRLDGELGGGSVRAERGRSRGLRVELEAAALMAAVVSSGARQGLQGSFYRRLKVGEEGAE